MEISELKQEIALENHLQYNHYPPVDLAFVPIAKQAIELANGGKWAEVIKMPNGIEASVCSIVEGLHLEYFIDYEEE